MNQEYTNRKNSNNYGISNDYWEQIPLEIREMEGKTRIVTDRDFIISFLEQLIAIKEKR